MKSMVSVLAMVFLIAVAAQYGFIDKDFVLAMMKVIFYQR